MKLVKKDCGKHWGANKGPCVKCKNSKNLHPSSIAAALEGTVRLSNGLKVEFTNSGRI
jgi:hypothetical protein